MPLARRCELLLVLERDELLEEEEAGGRSRVAGARRRVRARDGKRLELNLQQQIRSEDMAVER